MYVDPRVAHSRAKLLLTDHAVDPRVFDAKLKRILEEAMRQAMRKGNGRRQLRRQLDGWLAPTLEKHGFNVFAHDLPDGNIGVQARAIVADPSYGVREIGYAMVLGSPEIRGGRTYFTVTPHAIARCMQRNRKLRLSEIRLELVAATALAPVIFHVAMHSGWYQAAIPTPAGMFVGEFSRGNGLVMRTYIQPGASGRRSRWEAVLEALPRMPPECATIGDAAIIEYKDTVIRWLDENLEEFSRSVAFLREPYERGDDPQGALWNAAMTAAAA
ncbi:hypothetical protein P3T23_008360 [Paraburkholderia sp. GAS448]|uniref:hypothetical protein n=1 Tax=Paraburkholderia sp. GAS448 TaxID=3035136 RepID=UPI003D1EA6C3